MKQYQCTPKAYVAKEFPLKGRRYSEVFIQAQRTFRNIEKRTKRHPYIRCKFFKKDKIFLTHFWKHLKQKPISDQIRRMKLIPCAIEVISKSTYGPISKINTTKPTETLHRFYGKTKNGMVFFVQIKENNRTKRKELISIFPLEKSSA